MRKKILWSLFLLLIVGLGLGYYFTFVAIDYDYLNAPQRYLAESIFAKWDRAIAALPEPEQNIVRLDDLEKELSPWEKFFEQKVLAIPAADLGFKGKYFGLAMPDDLVQIPSKVFDVKNGLKGLYETEIQYYPKNALADFEKMNAALEKALGKKIWIDSGYRSPGKQAYLFFKYLGDPEDGNNFSLKENAKWIALPGYSEHGSSTTPAFDFALDGGDSIFEKPNGEEMSSEESQAYLETTPEYKWLLANAAQYHFFLSYPRENPDGVNFEPWHWHWEEE
ncbi:MAG: D-alanyl-D-alanine carboxypeptidase family protein [Patescibacteria group bacterium]